ncbi:pyruvate formate lyase activating enzyme [Fonticella tunisiensis]|uniref:Pyruvate formate lyase activating enzyme n=2 Tax=Fonticella tunisiensis TaxID=1096341 RepID=A0A4R7KBC5_9CLOT|nr:pyruvate formate lyase activating enzyme [Fonticella tunisiensis]
MFYERIDNKYILCYLCPHHCHLKNGQRGICKVRRAEKDRLYTVNYGEISSLAIDPVEKKPLYHYKPGKTILSVGGFGCNFSCGFCQNYSISKSSPETKYVNPEQLLKITLDAAKEGSIGIAFTYNEPSIWYEYIFDFLKEVEVSINKPDIVLVTNGYIEKEPLKEMLPHISAMNIDLKGFNDGYYKNICMGSLDEVLSTIELSSDKTHVELTTLIIDGYNNSDDEIEEMAKWIASIDKDIPLHLSRYYPAYKFTDRPTKPESLRRARDIARKYLNYVYIGNLPGEDNNTYCPECGGTVVERYGYYVMMNLNDDRCQNCGNKIKIVL